jgi:hypothetical protein
VRALEMALRVSGRVAHAMACRCPVSSSERLWSVPESLRIRSTCARGTDADLPDDLVPFVRETWSRSRARSARPDATDTSVRALTNAAPVSARMKATICTSSGAPPITPSMLDLCSAPCKARRFAPPARARGLWALTVSAHRSGLGQYVMAGGVMANSWTDVDR